MVESGEETMNIREQIEKYRIRALYDSEWDEPADVLERLLAVAEAAKLGLWHGWNDADDTGHTPASLLRQRIAALEKDDESLA